MLKVRPTANNNNNNNTITEDPREKSPSYHFFDVECKVHYRKDCPKMKNGNQGNRAGNGNAVARAYVVGFAGTNPNSNVVTGTFLLNNRYASILFDTGADRSFISTALVTLDIIPNYIDHGYDVSLGFDGRIIWVNTLIRGCTLNFLNHPFNIDLMPVEMGSFDVIIGMDWLAKYHAIIVCDEKVVRVPFGDKILIFNGDGSNNGYYERAEQSRRRSTEEVPNSSRLSLSNSPDFPGIPRNRQVEFQIDLIPGAAPIDDLFDQLQGSRYSTQDRPKSVIIPTKVREEDIPKTAIRNSIWTLDKQEHAEHLKLILELLKKEQLYAKFSKCEFWIPKVQFLGHVIDSQGIHVDPAKIESVKDWASPKSATEIR
ncbi:putative reverse transcriptase domain-containing protein [Tanacetum coccineum]|uniref:Reverse transcriptase domain-containing protein n=1 Tax=Tanacetum coccineum TaxID=301880 RepID=A0ABQ5EF66_9ASTR